MTHSLSLRRFLARQLSGYEEARSAGTLLVGKGGFSAGWRAARLMSRQSYAGEQSQTERLHPFTPCCVSSYGVSAMGGVL
jgi:hypothetical protein